MEEKLQKVREKLVKEKRERRDKASSLIEVLKKSKIITEEEKEEIRKRIIDNFNKKEDTGVYEEVNKKFGGIREIRREIAKINKEIKKEENKLAELEENISEIKKMDLRELTSDRRTDMGKKYNTLLNQKEDIQEKINELNERKQKKEEEERDANNMLGIDIKEKGKVDEEEQRIRRVSVTLLKTEEIQTMDVPMKQLGKKQKRWKIFGGEAEIEENTAIDEEDTETYTPKMYYKQKEGELRALEEDYERIKEKLGEDIYLDEGYKTDLLSKLTERYNRSKEEIEKDERYKEIKEKQETLKKKLEEMEKKKMENDKEIEEIRGKIEKIEGRQASDKDKAKEFELLDKEEELSAENYKLSEEIRRCKEEYGEYEKEEIQSNKKLEGKRDEAGIYKVEIGGKTLEVEALQKKKKPEGKGDGSRGSHKNKSEHRTELQVKWGGSVIGKYKEIYKEQLICEVGGKPMFWVRKTDKEDREYRLVWGNDEYNVIKGFAYYFEEIGGKPCIAIEKKNGRHIVIWGDKQIGSDYYKIEGISDAGGKPCFGAKKEDGTCDLVWGNKKLSFECNDIKVFKDVGGKPCFGARKEDGDYEIIWGNEKLGKEYECISGKDEIGGKPCCMVMNKDGSYNMIWGDEEILDKYCTVTLVDDEHYQVSLYSAQKEENGKKVLIMGNKQIGEEYEKIDNIRNIGGKPFFVAENTRGKRVAMWGEEQLGNEYEEILVSDIQDIGGKPCFWARKGEKWIVMWGEKQICGTHHMPIFVNKGVKKYFGKLDERPCFGYMDERGIEWWVTVISDSGESRVR